MRLARVGGRAGAPLELNVSKLEATSDVATFARSLRARKGLVVVVLFPAVLETVKWYLVKWSTTSHAYARILITVAVAA